MAANSRTAGFIWGFPIISVALCSCLAAVILYFHSGPTREEIAAGKSLFVHEFTPGDALCGDGDGLGPVFNEVSCVACHFQGGVGGAGPNEKNAVSFEVFPVPGRPEVVAGGVHTFAVERTLRESTKQLTRLFPVIPGAIRSVNGCSVQTRDFDPVQLEEINTPPLFGLAAIERISDTALSVHAAKRSLRKIGREFDGDFEGTGVGRLRTPALGRIGKFGWKGQFATIEEFVANACAMELGLTNHRVAQTIPNQFIHDDSAKLDMSKQQLYELVSFVKNLPPPRQVIPDDPKLAQMVSDGEAVFAAVGCADCHVPNMGGAVGVYSDFHLYEVENEKVVDTYQEPDFDSEFTLPFDHPRPSEWKTPPLWGVADSAPYFHDGGSPTLLAAIMRHGRDGKYAREQFESLPDADKKSLLAFLKSLQAPDLN